MSLIASILPDAVNVNKADLRGYLAAREVLSIADAAVGGVGDDAADNTAAFDTAHDILAAVGGGILWVPNGIYRKGKTAITASMHIQGESITGTVFHMVSGSAGDYCFDVDLTLEDRPLAFSLQNCSIKGNTATRAYNGVRLDHVLHGRVTDIMFQGVGTCLTLDASYWSTFERFHFEHYDLGIHGVAPEGGNANTFIAMHWFEGNADGDAVPLDTTNMNNCTFIGMDCGASTDNPMDQMLLAGNDNTFISPRFESIYSDNDWVALSGSRNTIEAPLIGFTVTPATGKFVFSVSGNDNEIRGLSLEIPQQLIYLAPATLGNKVRFRGSVNNFGGFAANAVVNFGDSNDIEWGTVSRWTGVGGAYGTGGVNIHSDALTANYFTRSVDFNDAVTDGLTQSAVTAGVVSRGPLLRGGVTKFDTPTGNRIWKESIGTVIPNQGWGFAIDVMAVSGTDNLETIEVFVERSSEMAAPALNACTVRDDRWTRIFMARKFSGGSTETGYVGMKLGAASSGVYVSRPDVTAFGTNASPSQISEVAPRGYVATGDAVRAGFGDTGQVMRLAAPAAGLWEAGNQVWNLAAAAGGPPGWVCTTGGEPGTWKAMASLEA